MKKEITYQNQTFLAHTKNHPENILEHIIPNIALFCSAFTSKKMYHIVGFWKKFFVLKLTIITMLRWHTKYALMIEKYLQSF